MTDCWRTIVTAFVAKSDKAAITPRDVYAHVLDVLGCADWDSAPMSKADVKTLIVGLLQCDPDPKKTAKPPRAFARGAPLGESASFVKHSKTIPGTSPGMAMLHRICFGTPGTATTRKRDLAAFRGLSEPEAAARRRCGTHNATWHVNDLRMCCTLLGLRVSGRQEELVKRITDRLHELRCAQ